jgi:hypothetical protein
VPQDHRPAKRGQRVTQLDDQLTAVERLAAVPVAVDGEQDDRLDLGEPIDDRSRPEVR